MNLVKWKPSGELDLFRKEMDNLFKSFFGEQSFVPGFGSQWAPLADITETKDTIVVKAELPGLEAKDIDITLSNDLLTIRGEKRAEKETKNNEQHYFAERYYGKFQRSFQLPTKVRENKVEAIFTKGVLKITLPKTEEAKPKEIKIAVK